MSKYVFYEKYLEKLNFMPMGSKFFIFFFEHRTMSKNLCKNCNLQKYCRLNLRQFEFVLYPDVFLFFCLQAARQQSLAPVKWLQLVVRSPSIWRHKSYDAQEWILVTIVAIVEFRTDLSNTVLMFVLTRLSFYRVFNRMWRRRIHFSYNRKIVIRN